MSIYNYKQRNNIILAILIALSITIIYSIRIIAGALLSTIVLYVILRPIFLFLVYKWNWKKWIAAIFTMLSSLIIIVLPFVTLTRMMVNKVSEFETNTPKIKKLIEQVTNLGGSKFFNQHHLLDKDKIIQGIGSFISEVLPLLIGGIADIILGLIIIYFLLYFMFVQHVEFENNMLKYAPFKRPNALKFAKELENVTYSNVLGQGFIAIVQGSLVGVGFLFFGISDAFFWGTISAFISFLPVIGSSIVFVPAAIIELAHGDNIAGWGLLLWGFIVVTNIDNVIRFMIAKRVADTHPVITVMGVIIGVPIFGLLGIVFGPLLLSYFILTVKIYESKMSAERRLKKIKLYIKNKSIIFKKE